MSLMDILMEGRTSPQDRYAMIQQMGGMGGGMPSGGMGGVGGSSDWEQRAKQYFMNKEGYSPEDWQKVDYIIEHESGWDPTAYNESSGAAGIPQNIRGWQPGWQENPMKQIRWLANYLAGHNYPGYGTGIDAAYAHKQATGWY